MKSIKFHQIFDKHYAQRIKPDFELSDVFSQRYNLFLSGERRQLDDMELSGGLNGLRSFAINDNIRVVYIETDEHFVMLDVGLLEQLHD